MFNKAASEEIKKYAQDALAKRLDYVETQLANEPYLTGDHFTVADAYLFVVEGWSSHVGLA